MNNCYKEKSTLVANSKSEFLMAADISRSDSPLSSKNAIIADIFNN